MKMYLILLNLMLCLTLAQAEKREGLEGRSQLIRAKFNSILSRTAKGLSGCHDLLGVCSWSPDRG